MIQQINPQKSDWNPEELAYYCHELIRHFKTDEEYQTAVIWAKKYRSFFGKDENYWKLLKELNDRMRSFKFLYRQMKLF